MNGSAEWAVLTQHTNRRFWLSGASLLAGGGSNCFRGWCAGWHGALEPDAAVAPLTDVEMTEVPSIA